MCHDAYKRGKRAHVSRNISVKPLLPHFPVARLHSELRKRDFLCQRNVSAAACWCQKMKILHVCPVYPSTSTSRFSTWWYQFISVTNRNILIKTTACTCRPGSGALQWHCFYHGCSRTQLCGVMCLLLRSKHNLRGWNLVSLHCNLLQSVLMKCFNTCSDSCTSTKRIYLNKTLFFSERICLFVCFFL